MSFTQNSDTTTKWPTPDIVHYIVDRERFQTQLLTLKEITTVAQVSVITVMRDVTNEIYTLNNCI